MKFFNNLQKLIFGALTKKEMASIRPSVLLALDEIKNDPTQLKYTKKLIWLLEED